MDYGRDFSDEELAKALAEERCTKCNRPALDLRGMGFNALYFERTRQCFWFGKGTLQCNAR